MTTENKLEQYINAHPSESLQLLVIVFCLIWQSVACMLGLICYFIFSRYLRISWWIIFISGLFLIASAIFLQQGSFDIKLFMYHGFQLNILFWKQLFIRPGEAIIVIYEQALIYLLGIPIFMAGILSAIDLISHTPHKNTMKALQKGKLSGVDVELSENEIKKTLMKLPDDIDEGTVLGVSKYSGEAIIIPDHHVNQVVLVLGTTGSGKTITLRRFYKRAITQAYPLIIIDGKPDDSNINWLMQLAKLHNREFFGFNCGNLLAYDPLASGGYTELKDKIISLKDEWSSDHYRTIAEAYLQTTLEVLLRTQQNIDLKAVVDCLNYDDLLIRARETKDKNLLKRVASLENYDRKDITGLQAHLDILIHSELGHFFEKNEKTFSLTQVIQQQGVVYFALPALRFPSFSTVLGKLVINDIKAVVDRIQKNHRIFTVFDEFSVFAGQQVLNLVNMGRGKNVHAIFGTQGLADLEKIDATFKDQVLNCANTIICHRLNDQNSAESMASLIGTKDTFTVTAQISSQVSDANMGTVKQNKEFIVHPDAIKQGLQTGEAFYVTKVDGFRQDKVRVKFV